MATVVTGGTGFVGSHLVESLVESGRDVICIVRPNRPRPKWLRHRRIRLVEASLLDRAALEPAFECAREIFHVAGATKALSDAEFFRANALTTKSMLEVATRLSGLRRFVLVSSQAVAGPSWPRPGGTPRDHEPVREELGFAPVSPYGQSKVASEVIATRYRDRISITVVRPATVYGPRDWATLPFFRLAKRGIWLKLSPNRPVSLVHVADVVRGIILASETVVPSGRTYFLRGPEDASLADLMILIAAAVGRPGIWLPVPDTAVHAAATIVGIAARLSGRPSIFGRDKAKEITAAGWICDGSRARAELGYEPEIPLREGIPHTVHWYQANGFL